VNEGTALLDILAGRASTYGRVLGDFMLNGNPVTMSRLGARTTYVRRDYRLHPEITVFQTMKFHSMLRKPIRSSNPNEKGNKVRIESCIYAVAVNNKHFPMLFKDKVCN